MSNESSTSSQVDEARIMKPLHPIGSIVTIDLKLTPEDGFVPEPLFDTMGRIKFCLGWGNYLPGLHELVRNMPVGASHSVSLDAGWGSRNDDLIIQVPKSQFVKLQPSTLENIHAGDVLNLQGGKIQVSVIEVTDSSITVDANPPLAGSSYACKVTLLKVEPLPYCNDKGENEGISNTESPYQVACFAMGCFWGGELAFQRTSGVVGTRVGYTQGITADPSYEDVCTGSTKHREAVQVIYDPKVVSYSDLVQVFWDRLAATTTQYTSSLTGNLFDAEDEQTSSSQYQHGIYFSNQSERETAERFLEKHNNKYNVELKRASTFYKAEEYHQQYLLKGGQSAKKGAKETIRCFG